VCLEANQEAHRRLLTANQPELNSLWVLRQKLATMPYSIAHFGSNPELEAIEPARGSRPTFQTRQHGDGIEQSKGRLQ
jgi:hypothetical protein